MESKWSDSEAEAYLERYRERCNADQALRVYTSRLIGQDARLVLHGGGNTSVKTSLRDDLGHQTEVLCVKGSGWDLASVEPEGLPAVRLKPLQALRELDGLSDEAMVNAQRTRLLDASAPNPSVETLLHAFLPHKFIDHSHADAVLSIVNQPDAARLCRERYGRRFGVVPYVMPGFALAKLAAETYERDPDIEGLLLLHHGLFTFGDSARESYERHIRAVDVAESFCQRRRYWSRRDSLPPIAPISYAELAPILRGRLGAGERRYVLTLRSSPELLDFVDDPQLDEISQVGCATPDHVIRTKRLPMILRLGDAQEPSAVAAVVERALGDYREAYRDYVQQQMSDKGIVVRELDPDPRIILVPKLGMIAAGATAKAAGVAADIYEHTVTVIRNAQAVDTYEALPESDIFDMEYWSLEQAKLGKGTPPPLQGQVVCITGAARGIGAETARLFAERGAHLYLIDRDEDEVAKLAKELGCAHEALDVGDETAVRRALTRIVEHFGGIDGVVSNAGVAPQGAIDECSTEQLQESFRVNFYAHHWLASGASLAMKRQGTGGFLLFNVSKAAFNPGAGFGPYAVPKAALMALVKQYALELGEHGVRACAINADRVRTDLLDQHELEERARARGLSADEYYRSNLLRREVSARDVAEAFLSLALARSTTGSVLTVDGGNIAASPR